LYSLEYIITDLILVNTSRVRGQKHSTMQFTKPNLNPQPTVSTNGETRRSRKVTKEERVSVIEKRAIGRIYRQICGRDGSSKADLERMEDKGKFYTAHISRPSS
jgi:hypothetical protein